MVESNLHSKLKNHARMDNTQINPKVGIKAPLELAPKFRPKFTRRILILLTVKLTQVQLQQPVAFPGLYDCTKLNLFAVRPRLTTFGQGKTDVGLSRTSVVSAQTQLKPLN